MTIGERDLEAARQQILQRMQKPQSQQAFSQLRQELRAIDIELDNVKRIDAILADAPPVAPVHAGIAGWMM
jgi:predicted metal-dependent HD superfamily phosphohydrolase